MAFEQWVRIYPGMGFVLTVRDRHLAEVIERFGRVGMTARSIGTVNDSRELAITHLDEHSSVFDFTRNGIMHLTSEDESCRP